MYAAEKLKRKNCDYLVANDVSQAGAGFGTDTNIVLLLHKDGTCESLPLMSKNDVALHVLRTIYAQQKHIELPASSTLN